MAQLLQLRATGHLATTAGRWRLCCSRWNSAAVAITTSCCTWALCMVCHSASGCVAGAGCSCAAGAEGGRQGHILAGQLVTLRGEGLHLHQSRATAGSGTPKNTPSRGLGGQGHQQPQVPFSTIQEFLPLVITAWTVQSDGVHCFDGKGTTGQGSRTWLLSCWCRWRASSSCSCSCCRSCTASCRACCACISARSGTSICTQGRKAQSASRNNENVLDN